MPYIKLPNDVEYRESEDGLHLQYRRGPSSLHDWINHAAIPTGLRILAFKEIDRGANIELLLSDDRWYHINSNGFITLTQKEKEKDRQAQKVAKEEEKRRKEASQIEDDEDDISGSPSYSSSYSYLSYSAREEEGYCKKFIYTIIPILPIWWIIKLPFSIITYPLRALCSSKNKSLLPSYSFKKF